MPSIEEWKSKNKGLLEDIDEFQENPDLLNPYKLLKGLSGMMVVVATMILPHTQALKIIVVGLKLLGGFLKGYSEKRADDG